MAPKFTDRSKFIMKQGGVAEVAFDAIDANINYVIRIAIFSRCELNSQIEIAKE
jgi:hypothetical protein